MLVINSEMVIEKANNAFYTTFGLGNGRVETQKVREILAQHPDLKALTDVFREVQRDGFYGGDLEAEIYSADKGVRTFSITARPVIQDPKSTNRVLMVFNDITSRRNTEKRREEFISYVTHELRNPVTSVKAYLQLMRELIASDKKELASEVLAKVLQVVDRFSELIADLHDVSKATSGKLQIEKASFNFNEFIREVIETAQVTFSSHKIVQQGIANTYVYGDRYRLQQVLTNYLSNAIKYSAPGDTVEVDVSLSETEVFVSVRDYGIGVPKEDVPKLFTRFYRTEVVGDVEGLGLGLFMSKEIVNAHGGEVGAKSEPDKGSVFWFSIPLSDGL